MSVSTSPFQAEDYIKDPQDVAAYLAAALETGDADFVRKSLAVISRSPGLSAVAKRANVDETSLRDELTRGSDISSILKLFATIGVRLEASVAASEDEAA